MFGRYTACGLPILVLAGACARHSGTDARTTSIPADVPAELRVVAGESTYVTRGPGYELIARSRRDLGFVAPAVDREIANFRRVFPSETTTVIATVRPAPVAGRPFVTAPLTPNTYPAAVDLVLPDAKAHRDEHQAGMTS